MRNRDILLEVAKNMHLLADSLIAAVNNTAEKPAEAAAPEDKTVTVPPSPAVPEKPASAVKLEEVRAVLAEKSHEGKTAAVRELLGKYGAQKLSEVDPANYASLLKEAEVL